MSEQIGRDEQDEQDEDTARAMYARRMAKRSITDPQAILTEALARVVEADELCLALFTGAPGKYTATERERMADQAAARLDVGNAYAAVAGAVIAAQRETREASRTAAVADLGDQFGADLVAAPEHGFVPQPVQGVRFDAELHPAHAQYVGMVGGREWLHLPGHGFIEISATEQSGPENVYVLTGRIVSATPDHIIGITDGGVGVTLPRALVIETEDR